MLKVGSEFDLLTFTVGAVFDELAFFLESHSFGTWVLFFYYLRMCLVQLASGSLLVGLHCLLNRLLWVRVGHGDD